MIFGIIIGITISVPTTIFADEVISIIGKRIETEVNVTMLGQKLDEKAPLLDGTTYVPIRAVTEKLDLVAEFVNGEVVIKRPNEDQLLLISKISVKKEEIAERESQIEINKQMIQDLEKRVIDEAGKTDYLPGFAPAAQLKIRQGIGVELNTSLAKLQAELTELEKQK